jgi:membrane protease subunit (stomatin/prohibitin family)
MGFRQVVCVDMNPIVVPEMYLCPKIDDKTFTAEAVRYAKYGETLPEGQIVDGAQFTIAPGQCVLLLRGGQIFDLCAVPGVYIYEENALASFLMGKLTRAGAPEAAPAKGVEQVVYLNTEEFGGNAFSCSQKLTFQTDDGTPISLMCRGRYCYRIANPILFYRYASEMTDRAALDAFLLEQFLTVLQPTYDRLASMGVTDSTLSEHTPELIATLRALLYDKWYVKCGIELQRVSITSVCMGSGFNPFGGTTVQADRDELSPDDQLEKAAKEFLGSVLSAFGSAFQSVNEKTEETPKKE